MICCLQMVPQYQPQAALAMLQKYLNGNVY